MPIGDVQAIEIDHINAAHGGQGQIHYGISKNVKVAIKEQKVETLWFEMKIIALLKEMAIMSYCNNINIAKISGIHFNSQQMLVWIIQPKYYITLSYALQQKKIKDLKKAVCYQILSALEYLHSVGLLHLDLKPDNIMFTTNEMKTIVLLDFGISNLYKENEKTKIFGMTPAYCPPEIKFNDLSYISPKADIFSFGIILFEIVTEKRAFPKFKFKNRADEIYNFIRSKNYDFFTENQPTNNKNLDELIRNCTHRDIDQRPTAAQALKILEEIQLD